MGFLGFLFIIVAQILFLDSPLGWTWMNTTHKRHMIILNYRISLLYQRWRLQFCNLRKIRKPLIIAGLFKSTVCRLFIQTKITPGLSLISYPSTVHSLQLLYCFGWLVCFAFIGQWHTQDIFTLIWQLGNWTRVRKKFGDVLQNIKVAAPVWMTLENIHVLSL